MIFAELESDQVNRVIAASGAACITSVRAFCHDELQPKVVGAEATTDTASPSSRHRNSICLQFFSFARTPIAAGSAPAPLDSLADTRPSSAMLPDQVGLAIDPALLCNIRYVSSIL
jgi:hypothetical protein